MAFSSSVGVLFFRKYEIHLATVSVNFCGAYGRDFLGQRKSGPEGPPGSTIKIGGYSEEGGAIAPDSLVWCDSAEYLRTAARNGRAAGGAATWPERIVWKGKTLP